MLIFDEQTDILMLTGFFSCVFIIYGILKMQELPDFFIWYCIEMEITRDFIQEKMSHCTICPRRCGTDRQAGRKGFCGVPAQLYVARAALHFWEEPCISGKNGSGTVFFGGCNLRCVYCQNREVAEAHVGIPITLDRLIEIFFELEAQNANNINLVTPTPYFPQIAFAAAEAKRQGLKIPFVCNCGGYEDPETLRILDGIIDIYLTDFKYMDQDPAKRYSSAGDYSLWAGRALKEMVRQCPEPVFGPEAGNESGIIMKRGVIVRHLLLPGLVKNAERVVSYVYNTYGDSVFLSLMSQYTPFSDTAEKYPEIGRTVTKRSYERLVDFALGLGVKNAYIQEGGTAKESFIPRFDGQGVQNCGTILGENNR